MDKIKESAKAFFNSIAVYLGLAVTAVIGILVYSWVRKNEELEAAKSQLALANTHKEVDVIEAQIQEKLADKSKNDKQIEELNKSLDLIAEKRKTIDTAKTDQQIEDYWNKK